jgi:hypothetical protein
MIAALDPGPGSWHLAQVSSPEKSGQAGREFLNPA